MTMKISPHVERALWILGRDTIYYSNTPKPGIAAEWKTIQVAAPENAPRMIEARLREAAASLLRTADSIDAALKGE